MVLVAAALGAIWWSLAERARAAQAAIDEAEAQLERLRHSMPSPIASAATAITPSAPVDDASAAEALWSGLSRLLAETQVTVGSLQPRRTGGDGHGGSAVELELTASPSQISRLLDAFHDQLPLAKITRLHLTAAPPSAWRAQLIVEMVSIPLTAR